MAVIPGAIPVTGFIGPTDSSDVYAVTDSIYGVDGLRNVADHTERDAITAERRRQGMFVGTQNDGKYWSLNAGPWSFDASDWTLALDLSAGPLVEIWETVGSDIQTSSSIFSPAVPNVLPAFDGQQDLGSVAQRWNDLHLSGVLNFRTSNGSPGPFNLELNTTLSGNHTQTLQDASGIIALLSDIPAAINLAVANQNLTGNRIVTQTGFRLDFQATATDRVVNLTIDPTNDGQIVMEAEDTTGGSELMQTLTLNSQNGFRTSASGAGYGNVEASLTLNGSNFDARLQDTVTLEQSVLQFSNAGGYWLYGDGVNETMIQVSNTLSITDQINGQGIVYAADYSSGYALRSLVDKEYVDTLVGTLPTKYKGTFVPGTLGAANIINHGLNTLDVMVQIWYNSKMISANIIEVIDANNVDIRFSRSNPSGEVSPDVVDVRIIGL